MIAPVRKTTLESVEAAMTISTMPDGERHRAGGRPGPRRRAAEDELRDRRRAGQREDADPGHEVVGRVEEVAGELRAERQEQAADRPRGHDAQGGEQEGAAHRGAGRSATAGSGAGASASATGSGMRQTPARAIAKSTNSATYGSTRGAGRNSTKAAETSTPRPMPPALTHAVGQPDAGRVAARVEVEQRGAGGAERGAGRQALHAARDEEPDDRVGEHEERPWRP